MSQIPFSPEERIRAVQRLGYTEREARFLGLAALHGGYFLRRQYLEFLARMPGGTAAALIEKVLAKGHAKGTTYAGGIHIYHLCARPFYKALGQEDNRNRRLRQPLSIRTKLMAFDFVLAHPGVSFLSTELEKTEYFLGVLRLDPAVLPTTQYARGTKVTARYFIEKFPIFLPPQSTHGISPVVSFCYVDEGAVGTSGFATFLSKYGLLFRAVPECQLIYVAGSDMHFEAAKRLFDSCCHPAEAAPMLFDLESSLPEMLAHFRARALYEDRQWDTFDRAKLIRFRADSERFSGPEFSALYQRWKANGEAGVQAALAKNPAAHAAMRGAFATYLLKENYDLFGSLVA